MKYLYHGSNIPNLKIIKPLESGHKDSYVYAVSDEAFASIFSPKKRNSLIARWGRNKEGIPYFCERVEGIFKHLYENKQSSIYKLESKNFYQKENMWKEEYVSKKEEPVVEEIKIDNIEEFLLKLEEQGKFQLIKYEDRKNYFPNIDSEMMDDINKLIEKYGEEKILPTVKYWIPKLYREIKSKV